MDSKKILQSDDFQQCVAFHGHVCPGLAIGYRAARLAMDYLRQNRSEDEEMVAIVETDACSADAVQVLTGCTFGKGNLIFKDHGKMVLTLASRSSGKGVRVALKPGAFPVDANHFSLMRKVIDGTANEAEANQFRQAHSQRSLDLLAMPADDLFTIAPVTIVLPPKARIAPSEPCHQCGEPTMNTKLETRPDGKRLCRDCIAIG